MASVDHRAQTPLEDALVPCHAGEVLCCAFAPRLAWAASGGYDGRVLLWDLGSSETTHSWTASPRAISSLAVTPDGSKILTGDLEGHLATWDVLSGREISREVAHLRPISGIAVSGNGRITATSAWDARLKLRYLDDEECPERTLMGHKDIVTGIRIWPDGKRLLSWSPDGTARLWETMRGNQLRAWTLSGRRLQCGDVSADGQYFAVGCHDGFILVWDIEQQVEVGTLGMRDPCCGLHFVPDCSALLAISIRGAIHHLRLPDLAETHRDNTQFPIQATAMPATGEGLALGGRDGTVRLHPLPMYDGCALWVTGVETLERRAKPGAIAKLFGQQQLMRILRVSCPSCGHLHEFGANTPPSRFTCPGCLRELLLSESAMSGVVRIPHT